jgi:hypothetical protein
MIKLAATTNEFIKMKDYQEYWKVSYMTWNNLKPANQWKFIYIWKNIHFYHSSKKKFDRNKNVKV